MMSIAPKQALSRDETNRISGAIVSAAMKVHSRVGPGLLESAYEACLAYELRQLDFSVERQVDLPFIYEGVKLDVAYRLDLLVGGCVIVEIKAIEKLLPVHEAQLISYLKLTGCRIGLLLNFHVAHMKDGVRRFVN